MPYDVAFRLPRGTRSEATIGALGFTRLRWDSKRGAYVARGTIRDICAMSQQPEDVLPKGCWEGVGDTRGWGDNHSPGLTASKETLRRFARAAAVADGNAFFGSALERADRMESQYMGEAMTACAVLEGLGVDPDAFAAMYPDPLACFRRLAPHPAVAPGSEDEEASAPSPADSGDHPPG